MSERRPIASRHTKLAVRVAWALAERGVAPNLISQCSMVFAALAGLAFWFSGMTEGFLSVICLLGAALGCQLRLLCNLFDGMVAVEGKRGAADGPFWNEAPDRVADTFIMVGLGLGAGHLSLGWAAAALAIATAYVRELGSAQGQSADFRGPMAKPQRMAVTTASAVLSTVIPAIFGWSLLYLALWIIVLGSSITVLRRSYGLVGFLRAASKGTE
ncbi:CDP-diacylglycerol--glycerol-3-phosphate 3-phosphatidyltransferase [Ruegeria sp. ANG-R]|uniref:CDP-alcohol phosphatidyltransferase family protein n=1 Tax=Ruegeria sp. ANG-R TaxID=1577903 RepID=UPI00057E48D9|nr:CDP-alcohol phosphatidyltransferase family protein [Ruegeria sp. ANG-R]KIC36660.1 CDP-diacylglycerol--glycerol-3-phosphate 3-phosphatidyltransferase [Ruegeria sp. ANG-R]